MRFKALKSFGYSIFVTHRCGDMCCSWREIDRDTIEEGEEIDVYFEIEDTIIDEEYCLMLVNDNKFVPVDEEAIEWYNDKSLGLCR